MRVAIVHYHLKPGGVTRVIENAVASLADHDVRCVVLSGGEYTGEQPLEVRSIEGLGYSTSRSGKTSVEIANAVMAAATEALGGEPDVWHIHNHSLGKNILMPEIVGDLLSRNQKLLLQIHDFAEDGRPTNYAVVRERAAGTKLYPQAKQIHYAVLNARDAEFLEKSGMPSERLHTLANPVSVSGYEFDDEVQIELDGYNRILLYPTRGIRRKNMGEMALWAAIAEDGDYLASTLGPANPEWLPIHDEWEEFASSKRLPLSLGVVAKGEHSFEQWMAAANAMISTSVAEGFGLAFLEPWAIGKPLVGRNLPDITNDFSALGVDLSPLYSRCGVPLEIFDTNELQSKIETSMRAFYLAYQKDLPDGTVKQWFDHNVIEGKIDFGMLDESLQRSAITAIMNSPELKSTVSPETLDITKSEKLVAKNREAIAENFSLSAYGKRLWETYRTLADSECSEVDLVEPEKVLDCFMDPKRFCLLRT